MQKHTPYSVFFYRALIKLALPLGMPNYLRPNVSGATIFFTVNLSRRGSSLLIDEIERFRLAVRQTKSERPFQIDAWVVLPDHMHCIWKLPVGDGDFPTR